MRTKVITQMSSIPNSKIELDVEDSERFQKDTKWLLLEIMRRWNTDPMSLNRWVPTYKTGAFRIQAVAKVTIE